jgi:RNA polymerase sigma factor (TIGR02999 family)
MPPREQAMLPQVYPKLRRLARSFLLRERPDHTLRPTALVHEAFLRLLDQREAARDADHYLALAAQMMRRILINHALGRKTLKRGGCEVHVPLDDDVSVPVDEPDFDMVTLDEALKELAALDPRQAKVVELRYFCGLSIEETAEAMDISVATVKRDWLTARLWLRRQLRD